MKRFLKTYFNFIDDLRRASDNAEEAGLGVTAGHLSYYADVLDNYKQEPRFLCDIGGNALSALKVWQKNTLTIANQYDRCVFNAQEIEDLARRLNDYAHTQKNCLEDVKCGGLDGKSLVGRPYITIGPGCSINFTPIKGDYEY